MKKYLLYYIFCLFSVKIFAQETNIAEMPPFIEHIEPINWWVGMKNPIVQVIVHGKNISQMKVKVEDKNISLEKVEKVENPNYLFLTLNLLKAKVGKFPIVFFDNQGNKGVFQYELLAKNKDKNRVQGINQSDFIYLLMPDRFANGDKSNDDVPDLFQGKINREMQYGRHGGDIQGVINHLDYLKNLGVTAIWMNPEIENNQPAESYHGYAATNLYKIDPRIGTNQLYQEYVKTCHQKGLKVVKDVVFNHIGNEIWWYKDLPSKDWVHQWKDFTRTNYRAAILTDPYSSQKDKKLLTDGWFDKHMPDLNQQNPFLATYLIQNSIWWVEYSGLDAYRIDTYPYPDGGFMAKWHKALENEFPTLGVFSESWMETTSSQAFYTKNTFQKKYVAQSPIAIDFQFYYAIQKAFQEDFGWDTGLMRLYYMLVQDYMYENAYNNVLFLDNHDVGRYLSTVKNDVSKLKMALTVMLTTRGIPSMYYGTEVLMANDFDWGNHDKVRLEFPGGWDDNPQNKFTEAGRSTEENEVWNYIAKIANYRKNCTALQTGKLTQFVPENGVYVYFRYDAMGKYMIVINSNKNETKLATDRFIELLNRAVSMKNIITDETITEINELNLAAKTAYIFKIEEK